MSLIAIRFVALSIVGIALAAPRLSSAADGEVFDEETGKPLAGVYVIGHWESYPPFGHDFCAKVDITRSDSNGKFSLPSWTWNVYRYLFNRETLSVYFYTPGYRWVRGFVEKNERALMTRDTRPLRARVEEWSRLGTLAECGEEDDWKPKVLPIYREMYAESRPLVVTDEEKASSRLARNRIEYLDLGRDESERREKKRGSDALLLCGADRSRCSYDPADY